MDNTSVNEKKKGSAPTWLYFVIPFISGFVGWFTNVLALHMTFYPLEFKGVKLWQPEGQPFGLFGWQVSFSCYHLGKKFCSVLKMSSSI